MKRLHAAVYGIVAKDKSGVTVRPEKILPTSVVAEPQLGKGEEEDRGMSSPQSVTVLTGAENEVVGDGDRKGDLLEGMESAAWGVDEMDVARDRKHGEGVVGAAVGEGTMRSPSPPRESAEKKKRKITPTLVRADDPIQRELLHRGALSEDAGSGPKDPTEMIISQVNLFKPLIQSIKEDRPAAGSKKRLTPLLLTPLTGAMAGSISGGL